MIFVLWLLFSLMNKLMRNMTKISSKGPLNVCIIVNSMTYHKNNGDLFLICLAMRRFNGNITYSIHIKYIMKVFSLSYCSFTKKVQTHLFYTNVHTCVKYKGYIYPLWFTSWSSSHHHMIHKVISRNKFFPQALSELLLYKWLIRPYITGFALGL